MRTRSFVLLFVLFSAMAANAQNVLTPELLWKLGRMSGKGISKDGKYVIYSVGTPDVAANKINTKIYAIPLTGGVPDIVDDGQQGFLIAPNDGAALAARIERVLADVALRRSMGERARTKVLSHFDAAKNSRRQMEVMKALVSTPAPTNDNSPQ